MALHFPIRFDPWFRRMSSAVLLDPADAFVEVDGGEVHVRMSWGFRARFPRSAVTRVTRSQRAPLSRGVHGFGGRWLVNGSGDGLVEVALAPPQRARVLGFPVRLRTLVVSVADPEALSAALTA